MSAESRRAARRERQAAKILGTTRTRRERYESAPDTEAVTLADGTVIRPEVKTRKALPRLLVKALEQAKGYGPAGAVPLAIVSETGGRAIACLDLATFARLVGLERPKESPQAVLPSEPPPPSGPRAVAELGTDEQRVVDAIADRLRFGARHYGALDVANDPRDWADEALAEALDMSVYLAIALLRRRMQRAA